MSDMPPPPPPKGGITIGKPKPQPQQNPMMASQMASITRRLRMVEESSANIRRKIELDEQNNIDEQKKLRSDIQLVFSEIDSFKRDLRQFKEDMRKIIIELQSTAKKSDVDKIEKYVDMWDPMSFVTQKDVSNIVRREMGHKPQPRQSFQPASAQEEVKEQPTRGISPEQKAKVAEYLNAHEDMQHLIMSNPEGFLRILENNAKLKELFAGIDIHQLSQRIKQASE